MAKKKLPVAKPKEDVAMLCVRVPRKRARQVKEFAIQYGVSVQVLIQYWIAYGMGARAHPNPPPGWTE